MPLTRSKSSRSSAAGKSILESERRELAAKESELQARIAEIQRSISEAPRRAAEIAERERESILNATRGQYRHSTLVDTRYVAEPKPRRARTAPTLRAERQAARRQALALLAILGAVIAWAACTYLQ